MTPPRMDSNYGTRQQRSGRALLAACLLLLAAGRRAAYQAAPIRAAAPTTQLATGSGLTGTITYLQTYKREKTAGDHGNTRREGEDTTIRGTWDVAGTSNSPITAGGQDAGATLTLDYYDHTYNSESSTLSLPCGPNRTFINVPTK